MAPRKTEIRVMTDEQLLGALILDVPNSSLYRGEIDHRHSMGNPIFKTYLESYNAWRFPTQPPKRDSLGHFISANPQAPQPNNNSARSYHIIVLLMKHIIEDKQNYVTTIDSLIRKIKSCVPNFREYLPTTMTDTEFISLAKRKRIRHNRQQIQNERAAFYYAEYKKSGGTLTGSMLLWDILINTDESVPNEKIFADYLKQKEGKRA